MNNKKIIEEVGGELTDIPNVKYQKFFAKFNEIETVDVKEWKPVHVLGYFCKKYKETYDIEYKFKFNSPSPSKCFEVFQIKKLSYLLTSQPKLLKDYIDWIFLNYVVKAKRRLTSISFMTVESITNEYKMNVLLSDKNANISRTTPLPETYKNIFHQIANVTLITYGDLAFLFQMEAPSEVTDALNQVIQLGLDIDLLKRIV